MWPGLGKQEMHTEIWRSKRSINKTGSVNVNTEACSRNHCCSGKAVSITYWSVCA
jgi:hypothetical protein